MVFLTWLHWNNSMSWECTLHTSHINSVCLLTGGCLYCAVLCLVALLCPALCDPMGCSLPGSFVHRDSPGKNTGVGSGSLLQGISPTQGSNPGLPHCRQILYCVSHQRIPRILEWVAYPFSRGSSQPKNQNEVSCIVGGYFTRWATSSSRELI